MCKAAAAAAAARAVASCSSSNAAAVAVAEAAGQLQEQLSASCPWRLYWLQSGSSGGAYWCDSSTIAGAAAMAGFARSSRACVGGSGVWWVRVLMQQ